ncbi:hypothetical protein ACXZ8K_08155 [Streptococcus agalactiae]
MPISLYDYSNSKIESILEINRIVKLITNRYYIDLDWLYGPNIMVVCEEKSEEKLVLNALNELSNRYKKIEIDYTFKEQVYLNEQKRLSELELRKLDKIRVYKHGSLIIRPEKTSIFNSNFQKHEFRAIRFDLNDLYMEVLTYLKDVNLPSTILIYFITLFKKTSSIYYLGEEFGYLSYLSHVMGFFSNIENRLEKNKVLEKFEKIYLDYRNGEHLAEDKIISGKIDWIIDYFKKYYFKMVEYYNIINIKEYKSKEFGYFSYQEQFEMFKEYISNMDNSYHASLLNMDNLESLLLSAEMLAFRDVINLMYASLPLFEQSMLKKHLFCYIVVQEFEHNHPSKVRYKFSI